MSASLRSGLERFLATSYPGARVQRLAGDASTRRFYRLTLPDGATRVVMDYGAPFEGLTDDVRLARVFEAAGLRVAGILEIAPDPGCLVLEDLGSGTLEALLRDRSTPRERTELLYRQAVELAAAVADRGTPALEASPRREGPCLDADRFRFEMDFFLENFGQRLLGRQVPERARTILHELAERAAAAPRRVFCHRDFHSRNLMLLADGSLAMVDIQDARWGPDTYDLASLLCDAYVDLDDATSARMREHYRSALTDLAEAGTFERRFHVVALERMIKALGTFGYQAAVLNRKHYLDGVPRTLTRIRRICAMWPDLQEIGRCLDQAGLLEPP